MKNQFLFVSIAFTFLLLFFALCSFSTLSNTYHIDSEKSIFTWQGSKLGGTHTGTIGVQKGNLVVKKNKIVGGKIELDMSSIYCIDIENREDAKKLEQHLKSTDFFDVDKFPLATMEVLKVKSIRGKNNYEVIAKLTIKNITKKIIFPAKIKIEKDKITANAKLTIDRTEYDVTYMSESVLGRIKDKFIYDNFDLGVQLVAFKK